MNYRGIVRLNSALRRDMDDLITRVPEPTLSGPSPFLLIVQHGPQTLPPKNHGLPFAPHPHRGFETVTFIRHGALLHEDSRSGARVVHAGGVQWMTAGSGIVHNEAAPPELRRDGGQLELVQLWLNLPSRLKASPPRYVGLEASDIPSISTDSGRATVNVIAGRFGDTVGAIHSLTDATILTVDLKAGGSITLPAPVGRAVLLYVVEGAIATDGKSVEQFTRVEFDESGERVMIKALRDAHLVYGHAPVIEEPVAAQGPFVMTTQEELAQAARDYEAGRFN